MMDFNDQKDLPKQRLYPIGNNVIRAERRDPYGFWHLSFERGQLPVSLTGTYTSIDQVEKAIEAYKVTKAKAV